MASFECPGCGEEDVKLDDNILFCAHERCAAKDPRVFFCSDDCGLDNHRKKGHDFEPRSYADIRSEVQDRMRVQAFNEYTADLILPDISKSACVGLAPTIAKTAAEQGSRLGAKIFGKAAEEGIKQTSSEITKEGAKQTAEQGIEGTVKEGIKQTTEQTAEQGMKEAGTVVVEQTAKQGTVQTAEEVAKQATMDAFKSGTKVTAVFTVAFALGEIAYYYLQYRSGRINKKQFESRRKRAIIVNASSGVASIIGMGIGILGGPAGVAIGGAIGGVVGGVTSSLIYGTYEADQKARHPEGEIVKRAVVQFSYNTLTSQSSEEMIWEYVGGLDMSDIDRFYHEHARIMHPDRHRGSRIAFERLEENYSILKEIIRGRDTQAS